MRPGSWLAAVLLLVACGGGQAAPTHPTPTGTVAETETVVVWLVWEPDLAELSLDRQHQCRMKDAEITIADEADTIVHQTDRGLIWGEMGEQVECRARTVLSGVPAAGFYQVSVSGAADYTSAMFEGSVTVEAGEEATVPLR